MNRFNSIRACLAAALVVFLAGTAKADYVIHLLHPGLHDTGVTRKATPPLIIANNITGMASPGVPMTAEGNDWYVYTIAESKIPASTQVEFHFTTTIPTQYNPTANALFFFNGSSQFNIDSIFKANDWKEIWITPSSLSGTPKPKISDLPPGKRVAYILNPWLQSAPSVKAGAATTYTRMKQSSDTKRCGWYYFPIGDANNTVTFKSNLGTQTYGSGGLGTSTNIDLTSQFALSDTVFVLPTPAPDGPPQLLSAFPDGQAHSCTYPLAVTIRDFSYKHPDFEGGAMNMGDAVRKGMVAADLGSDRKPVKGPTPHPGFQTLFNWFIDDTTNPVEGNRGYPTCFDLPLSKDKEGYLGYDSYYDPAMPSHSFFPIDDFKPFPTAANNERQTSAYKNRGPGPMYPNDPTGALHNFSFCMEMHAEFTFEKGQVFNFMGDDDVWVFVNNKLALDLGGTHEATPGSIKMDDLGLSEGQKYPFDMFYCDRQTNGSNLLVQTSIHFQQPSTYFVKTPNPAGGWQYVIREIRPKDRSCSAPVTGGDTVDAKSKFELTGPGLTAPELLPNGSSHGGVITINTNKFSLVIDTTKVGWDLRPGIYTIIYTTEGTGRTGQIKFTIPGSYDVRFINKRAAQFTGELAASTLQAIENNLPTARVDTLKIVIPPNLTVYSDSAKTLVIANGASIVLGADGSKRLYATSDLPGTYTISVLGGPSKTLNLASETFNFEKQLKVTLSASPAPGTFMTSPYPVTLTATPGTATIYYTIDGSDPLTSPTRITYAGPISLTATTTIQAYAVAATMIDSDVLKVTYTYTPPLSVKNAYFKDLNGDGRIETVIAEFDKDLPALPEKFEFTIVDAAGKSTTRPVGKAEIAPATGSKTTVVATLASPFDYGSTSVSNTASAGKIFKQDNIPTAEGNFAVADSVPPVLVQATVKEPDSTQLLKRIMISVSEDVNLPLTSQTVVVFKKDGVEAGTGKVKIHHIEKTGDRSYVVYIDSTSDVYPVLGDSIALNTSGEIKDGLGNTPAQKAFIKMGGDPVKPKPMNIYVTFPNSRKDQPSSAMEPQGNSMFIPVDKNGGALNGSVTDGKCPGCYTGTAASFVGPVFHIVTPGPMAYDFKIFNTHGEFVARGKGVVTAGDLEYLEKKNDAGGVKYVVRVVWTGRTEKGGKAATGAYILQSNLTSDKDPRTGAPPGRDNRRITFGMLRSFRGS